MVVSQHLWQRLVGTRQSRLLVPLRGCWVWPCSYLAFAPPPKLGGNTFLFVRQHHLWHFIMEDMGNTSEISKGHSKDSHQQSV